ncbi:MAG: twin-arginine translocation signal domain-containing protein, partial [Verrucomicrobiae bacterium]|nr:twin-arginine translocation signal domain-containing protein [Verrucomicrobiae bacterium]
MKTFHSANSTSTADISRRQFLKHSSLATAGTVAAAQFPFVLTAHAAPDFQVRVGVIGCGGRGTGAAKQAMKADSNVELYAMGDVFAEKIANSLEQLK